jgi:NTE family protein
MSDQSRSLRVRTLMNYLQQAPSSGAYLNINTPISSSKNCESAEFAASFPTTLRRLNSNEFDKLAEHGSAVAERARNDVGLL